MSIWGILIGDGLPYWKFVSVLIGNNVDRKILLNHFSFFSARSNRLPVDFSQGLIRQNTKNSNFFRSIRCLSNCCIPRTVLHVLSKNANILDKNIILDHFLNDLFGWSFSNELKENWSTVFEFDMNLCKKRKFSSNFF